MRSSSDYNLGVPGLNSWFDLLRRCLPSSCGFVPGERGEKLPIQIPKPSFNESVEALEQSVQYEQMLEQFRLTAKNALKFGYPVAISLGAVAGTVAYSLFDINDPQTDILLATTVFAVNFLTLSSILLGTYSCIHGVDLCKNWCSVSLNIVIGSAIVSLQSVSGVLNSVILEKKFQDEAFSLIEQVAQVVLTTSIVMVGTRATVGILKSIYSLFAISLLAARSKLSCPFFKKSLKALCKNSIKNWALIPIVMLPADIASTFAMIGFNRIRWGMIIPHDMLVLLIRAVCTGIFTGVIYVFILLIIEIMKVIGGCTKAVISCFWQSCLSCFTPSEQSELVALEQGQGRVGTGLA